MKLAPRIAGDIGAEIARSMDGSREIDIDDPRSMSAGSFAKGPNTRIVAQFIHKSILLNAVTARDAIASTCLSSETSVDRNSTLAPSSVHSAATVSSVEQSRAAESVDPRKPQMRRPSHGLYRWMRR
jgi:hypothetical protein